MSELHPPPTIEEFYKFCTQRKLMAVRCMKCRHLMVPPRTICSQCHSSRVEWAQLGSKGKLVTYTIVYVAPTLFNHMAPYAVGIVEMPEEVRLPSIIRTSRLESLKIGMELELDFSPRPQDPSWPQWPRYFFKETA
jgi:uncharacterized OB-fold protein